MNTKRMWNNIEIQQSLGAALFVFAIYHVSHSNQGCDYNQHKCVSMEQNKETT